MASSKKVRKHIVIPDTQVKPGVPTEHFDWIGEYIVEQNPDVVVHLGDHWDMPSLSSYDNRSGRKFEGRRYKDDIKAGNEAMQRLMSPIRYNNRKRKKKGPEFHFIIGNHEERIERAIEDDPHTLEGVIGYQDLDLRGWEVHPFLKVVEIDGVHYSHYFSSNNGRALGSKADTRLSQIGFSFTMGHQQGLQIANKHLANGKTLRGLIAGSCYLHDEDYMNPQGNRTHWRGIIVKHEVQDGQYCIMEVSLDYLSRKYTGKPLNE